MNFASEYVLESTGTDDSVDEYLVAEPIQQTRGVPAPVSEPKRRGYFTSSSDSEDEFEGFESCVMEFNDQGEHNSHGPPVGAGSLSLPPTPRVSSNTVKFSMKSVIQEPPEKTLPSSQRIQCCRDGCEAVLSHIDRPIIENGKKFWRCKFCGQKQEVPNWPEMDHDQQDVLYMDEALGQRGPLVLQNIRAKDAPVIFVIDTSGSMCSPVENASGGRLNLASLSPTLKEIVEVDQAKFFSTFPADCLPQIFDPMASLTHINRIQTVKDGLIGMLHKMPKEQRVGLVVFNSEVTIYGDCSSMSQVIPEEHCRKVPYKYLLEQGERHSTLKPIKETAKKMEQVIKNLSDAGQTALGPALTVALGMARKVKGSKIIICTDGVATTGVGSLEFGNMTQTDFYNDVADTCKFDGVAISIVSFDDCGMADRFGSIPNETGGQVEKVSYGHTRFQSALEKDLSMKTFATEVHTRFTVGRDMYVDEGGAEEKRCSACASLGNINISSQPCYTFAFRPPAEMQSIEESMDHEPTPVPSGSQTHAVPNGGVIPAGNVEATLPQSGGDIGVIEAAPMSPVESNPPTFPTAQPQLQAENVTIRNSEESESTKESPFQYEVKFTTMAGQTGRRVWTSVKPVTNSVQKAEEKANPETLISNMLQTLSEGMLRNHKNIGTLIELSQTAGRQCDDQIRKCKSNSKLVTVLADFKKKALNVARNKKLDEDFATELRQRQNGQI